MWGRRYINRVFRKTRHSEILNWDERRSSGCQDIMVFGDSHSKFFFETPFYAGRLKIQGPLHYKLVGRHISAASVAGFRRKNSKTQVRETVSAAIPDARRLILAFGQVDLELGYYYRLAVKGEQITPDDYVDWLLDIYADFIRGIPAQDCELVLKGANLTALFPESFTVRYVSRIVTEGTSLSPEEGERIVEPFILSEDAQNAMHLRFNAGLAAFAAEQGAGYFDLIEETAETVRLPDGRSVPRLAEEHRTASFDHHLADTVVVRRMHYTAAGRAFGLV